jgi:hypothetical protein
VLLQHLDDLLFGKSALAHVRLPKEQTLPKFGDICGEQVMAHVMSIIERPENSPGHDARMTRTRRLTEPEIRSFSTGLRRATERQW